MRKIIAMLLIVCMLLPLAACGETKTPAPAEPSTPAAEPAPTEPAPAEPAPAEPAPTEPAPAEPAAEPEPEPAAPTLYTREQMQQAVCQTALAYYYHNPAVQYQTTSGSLTADVKIRPNEGSFLADDAEADDFVYTVCSDFGWRVYKEATGWTYSDNMLGFVTKIVSAFAADDPLVVYKFRGGDGETDVNKAIEESRAVLQPGDLICYYAASSGHMMVYVGDLFGDGKEHILHSDATGGGNTNYDTGVNPLEPNGSIQDETTEQIVYNKNDRYIFADNISAFTIVRPTNVLLDENGMGTLTPEGGDRLAHPYMAIHKTFDRSMYDGVQNGETMECTVAVTNNSREAYTGLTVNEPVPAGQTFVSATEGGKQENGSVVWTVDVPAGKTVNLTYRVKISGKPGDIVTFERGSVLHIPTRTVSFQICGKGLNDTQLAALASVGAGSLPEGFAYDSLNTVNRFYQDVLGIDPKLPATLDEMLEKLFVKKSPVIGLDLKMLQRKDHEKLSAELQTIDSMILQKHLYGRYAFTGMDPRTRVLEFIEDRYQPGDVFVNVVGGSSATLLNENHVNLQFYLGNGKVLYVTTGGAQVRTFAETAALNLRQDFGFVLRPTLAYEDISTSSRVEPVSLQALVPAELSVALTAEHDITHTIRGGETVTYTATVTNPAAERSSTGTLKIGVTLEARNTVASVPQKIADVTGGGSALPGELVWNVPQLNPGESRSYTFSVTLTAGNKQRQYLQVTANAGANTEVMQNFAGGAEMGGSGFQPIADRFAEIAGKGLSAIPDDVRTSLAAMTDSTKVYARICGYLLSGIDGKNWNYPDPAKTLYSLFFTAAGGKYTPRTIDELASDNASPSSLVNGLFGGTTVEIPADREAADPMKVTFERGDVMIAQTGNDKVYSLYVGDGRFVRVEKDAAYAMTDVTGAFAGCDTCDVWVVFRVSQGLANCNTKI